MLVWLNRLRLLDDWFRRFLIDTSLISEGFLGGIVAALPTEASALEAKSIVAPIALQYPNTFRAPPAEITLVEVKPTLH